MFLTEPLARVALYFTPPAYFALGVLGLSVIASLSSGSIIKGLMAGVIGLMIATIGTDPVSGVSRFTFDRPELLDGVPFILVMVGVFAVSELLVQAGAPDWNRSQDKLRAHQAPELFAMAQDPPRAGDRQRDRDLRRRHARRRRIDRGVHVLQ